MTFKLYTYRFFTLLLSSTLFFSCGQDSKQAKQETKTEVKTVKQNASPIEKLRALNKETAALKALEPITISKLENWLPETVLNMKKTKGGALSQDGITGINASYLEEHPDYGKDYGKSLNILIIDGHGEQGAAAVMPFVAINMITSILKKAMATQKLLCMMAQQ